MSIKIGKFAIWMSADEARALGCTHHARLWGIIPGFFSEEKTLWISRSDLLNWLEDLLDRAFLTLASLRGDDAPVFGFEVGAEIRPCEDDT